MIKALAPGMRRGCSWVWVSIALACGFPPAVHAQVTKTAPATPKAGTPATKAGTPAAKAGTPAAKAAPRDEDEPVEKNAAPEEGGEEKKGSTVEVFKDPNAEAALKVFKSVQGLRPFPPAEVKAVINNAASGGADRVLIQRFVSGMAYDLTNKTNINALINPPPNLRPNAEATRAIQRATDNLIEALQTARLAKNNEFLTVYNEELLRTLPLLLDNNLISRIQAMIVLGQTGNPNAVQVFLDQLKDPKQTVWVKLWAARGLTRVAENGTKVDSVNVQPIESARRLADLLENAQDLPWPVQLRALEALGSMRVASLPNSPKAEFAATAMKFLADPAARPEVRAQAAWALGMLRVGQATRNFNYGLIAYDTGKLAAALGDQITTSIDRNNTLSEYLTGLLIAPIYQAFNGLDGARDSGLLKVPGGNPALPSTRQIADLSSAVTKAAVELVRATPGQRPRFKKDLGDRVTALDSYLDKNAPKDYRLVPNGKEFRPEKAEVAEGPGAKPEVAGGPGR